MYGKDPRGYTPTKFMCDLFLIFAIALTTWNFSAEAKNTEYSVGASHAKLDYCWYGASEACFNFDLIVMRVEAEHDSGFAVRYGYGLPMGTNKQTTITNQEFVIGFEKYREFELLYKYGVSDKFKVYGGIGYYLQTTPIYSVEGDLIHYDEDNDNGYFVGADYKINKDLTVELFIKQTSKIGKGRGSCDLTCQENWEAKGSTIRQIGVGIMWKF